MVFDKYNDVTHFIASIFIGLLKIQFLDQNENFKVKVNKIRAPPPTCLLTKTWIPKIPQNVLYFICIICVLSSIFSTIWIRYLGTITLVRTSIVYE